MGGMKVSELDFIRLLPAFMQDDEAVIALSNAMNRLIGEPSKRLKTLRVWDNIDNLNEAECDELAWELDVGWYHYDSPVEIKRAIIKNSIRIHRKMGTKYAVEAALQNVYRNASVEEWFEYGGKPYCFRVRVKIGEWGLTEGEAKGLEKEIRFYKNARSHCESITYGLGTACAKVYAGASAMMGTYLKIKAGEGR